MRAQFHILAIVTAFLFSCSGGGEAIQEEQSDTLSAMSFERVPSSRSKIDFTNTITENDTMNYLSFQYMYNGGGVGIGDINNDGLSDIYFTGNQVDDKLYLNKGDLQFEDITESAIGNYASDGWHTGVTMADVNQDGFIDIYVSRSGHLTFYDQLKNLLFINNGDNTFTEEGEKYGAAIARCTNQAAFFDMDNDGDLDLYLMNKRFPTEEGDTETLKDFPYSDMLLENVDGVFEDISEKAGIQNNAYGLGLAISDLNQDGFQDIYVSNDYIQPDFLYINQGDNTFVDEINTRTGHCSHFGMGNDVADFNNDGLVDIMTADMANEDHYRSKTNMAGMNPYDFWSSVSKGNQFEYMFNTLQLSNGDGSFSEIAQLSGVSKTDWSWAPLFADFDNDGLKDLFFSNGFRRDVRANDYVPYFNARKTEIENWEEILGEATTSKEVNYFFKNSGDLHFKKAMVEWKVEEAENTNGVAYADLDNDGDLDMVLNNMDTKSYILENKLESENNFLRVKCNKNYDGAKVSLYVGDEIFFQEMNFTRGFQSSVETIAHFGLGEFQQVDELVIEYKDGRIHRQKNLSANQLVSVRYEDSKTGENKRSNIAKLFESVESIDHLHNEVYRDDFQREILLPHKMSQLGPFMSKGDVNGDQLEDFYISGSKYFAGALYVQDPSGTFKKTAGPWEKETEREELGSLFFDADGDGDDDLYVTSGSNEYTFNTDDPEVNKYAEWLQDQLYINDGSGNFSNETVDRLPRMINSGQSLSAGDIDKDGDLDLFVGGRQVPGFYPFSALSCLLENENGVFKNITNESKDLEVPGMITASLFEDFDADGDLDLICVGEWMPISFFENKEGVFKNVTKHKQLDKTVGWWMSIEKGDFNGDGKNDYIVGNNGENNKFHPSKDKPLEIYVEDFDGTGTYDIVLAGYQNGTCYPVRGRQCTSQQMPFITEKFPTYDKFASADLEKIYGKTALDQALHYSATTFSSSILLSSEDGYTLERLPTFAQLGPVNAVIIDDFNEDGNLDVLAAGNNYGTEVETVRYDGGRGVLLLGNGKGGFEQLSPKESGFIATMDVKDLLAIGDLVFIASNSNKVKTFRRLSPK